MTTLTRLAALCALAGCMHRGGDDTTNAVLTLDPPSLELVLSNGVAARATYTATLTLTNGTRRDVTADTRFGIDTAYGSFRANELTMGIGGKAEVFGTWVDKTGTAEVTARVKTLRIDPSLPATTPGLFDHPDNPALAPQIIYPAAGVVMPRNIGDFEIHWIDSHASDVFEIAMHTEFSDVKAYVKGGNGVPGSGPNASWSAFQTADWFTATGTAASVAIGVRGANTKAPGNVGAAPMQSVALSSEAMTGGLYYWAAASTSEVIGIFRHDMAKPGEPAEEFLTSNQTEGRCVACHVVSRDGTKMAITYDGGGKPATMVDVATKTVAPITTAWNFGTFTPDNTQFLSIHAGELTVRDTATQRVLATMPSDVPVSHPDLSPDGRKLVYATNPSNSHDWEFVTGALYTRSYDQATRTFGPARPLVNDGANNFYPSWSPNGEWILFNKDTAGGNTYDDVNSTTWVVRADGSRPPVQLAVADQALGLTNSWARWAPFPQSLAGSNEPMYWITLASKRDFGARLRNTGLVQRPAQGSPSKRSQIWMTPFFPARAERGADPSTPVFRLPFQNLESSNHIAQWTERVVVIL
jgi:hypothetical protein